MVGAVATVVQHGEAVEVHAVALHALPALHQPALAHGDVVSPHGDAVVGAALVVVSLLVVVDDQFVHGNALRYQVVGDKLVDHVVLAAVVPVVLCIGVEILVDDPFLHVIHGDVLDCLAQCLCPELVGLGKEREAVLPVLGAWIACPALWRVLALGDDPGLHQQFVLVVLHCRECVDQAACPYELGHHAVPALGVKGVPAQRAAQCLVAWRDDVAQLVHISVDGFDVPVLDRHGADAVDVA